MTAQMLHEKYWWVTRAKESSGGSNKDWEGRGSMVTRGTIITR